MMSQNKTVLILGIEILFISVKEVAFQMKFLSGSIFYNYHLCKVRYLFRKCYVRQ